MKIFHLILSGYTNPSRNFTYLVFCDVISLFLYCLTFLNANGYTRFHVKEKIHWYACTHFFKHMMMCIPNFLMYFLYLYSILFYREKMELLKILITTIIMSTLRSQSLGAPMYSTPSTLQSLVTYLIPQKTTNATQEVWKSKTIKYFFQKISMFFGNCEKAFLTNIVKK